MSRLSDDEKRVFSDQISLLKNENERLTDRVGELEAEVALKADYINRLETEIAALKQDKSPEVEDCVNWREIFITRGGDCYNCYNREGYPYRGRPTDACLCFALLEVSDGIK